MDGSEFARFVGGTSWLWQFSCDFRWNAAQGTEAKIGPIPGALWVLTVLICAYHMINAGPLYFFEPLMSIRKLFSSGAAKISH
jgi:hypothetical protein